MKVIPRSEYQFKRYPNGAETLTVVRENIADERTNLYIGYQQLLVQRFSTCQNPYPGRESMGMPPTVKQRIIDNARQHEKAGALGVKDLEGMHKGKIAVICGSGPSLLKDVEFLKSKPKNVVLVAINGALKALPPEIVDYYFVLDWSAKPEWWDGYDASRIDLVTSPAAPPCVQDAFRRRYYFGGAIRTLDQKVESDWTEYGNLEVGLHASYSVLHLAYKMGCSRAVFTGHDYALTDMKYHWYEKTTAPFAKKEFFQLCSDMWGNIAVTGFKMARNAKLLNGAFILSEMDGMPCVNASQEGILLSERRAPMAEAVAEECPKPLVESFETIPEDVEEYVPLTRVA